MVISTGGIQQYLTDSWQALPDVGLYGPLGGIRLAEASPGTRILFLPLKAGGLFRLFGLHLADLRDQSTDLAGLLFPGRLRGLLNALRPGVPTRFQINQLEAVLLSCWKERDQVPIRPLSLTNIANASLPQLARENDLSPRQFERVFRQQNGFSLRHYRRQSRCQNLLLASIFGRQQATDWADWADLAATAGYFDQAHLLRDFRAFTGYTPADLIARMSAGDPAIWPYHQPSQRVARLFADTTT